MSHFVSQMQLLSILAENSRKPYPEVVDSESLAARLNLSLGKTREIVRCLDYMGVIQSDLEGRRSLITRKGIHWLERYSLC